MAENAEIMILANSVCDLSQTESQRRHQPVRLKPIDQRYANAEGGLAMVVVDQGFAIAAEQLHVALQIAMNRKAPIELRRTAGLRCGQQRQVCFSEPLRGSEGRRR